MPSPEIHTMQGRLLPPEDGRIQAFPRSRWREELALAQAAGVSGIEWIYETYGDEENPLTDAAGRERVRELAELHGVVIRSLCADWFMDRPLIRDPSQAIRLQWLVAAAGAAGIERLVLPCVDASRLRRPADVDLLVRAVEGTVATLASAGVELHLETDLAPDSFSTLLERLDHPLICANYDTGNSAALGYHAQEEWAAYGDRIGSIHIKDRVRGGATVPLGEGDADLEAVFDLLVARGWTRPVVLQVARGRDGDEVGWVAAAAARVRQLWEERSRLWI
jgi:L-ribulose-5-phosphate 3-epimerase